MASNTTFVSGAILTAQQQNNFPFGVQGYVKRTAGSVSVTTTMTDITGVTVSFTAITGRAYKVTANFTATKNTAIGTMTLQITDGTPTVLYEFPLEMTAISSGYLPCISVVVTGLSAGSQTLKLRASVSINTGTIFATAANPLSFIVEDIGIA